MKIKNWPAFRDVLLFLGGLAGVAHETLLSHSERPTLLILFAAMMGLPAFLRADEKSPQAPPQLPYPQSPPSQPGPLDVAQQAEQTAETRAEYERLQQQNERTKERSHG